MKRCATCLAEKSETEFHRKADARDWLHPHCKVCRKAKDAQYRQDNIERLRAYDRERYRQPERNQSQLAGAAERYKKDKPKRLVLMAQYAKDKPEIVRRAKDAYKARNPHKVMADTRRRQTRKLHAVPKWAESEFEQFAMEEMYDLARRRTQATGFKWHVDHAVPLLNKRVCGLHCVANLQAIPALHNLQKGNRVWPDMP